MKRIRLTSTEMIHTPGLMSRLLQVARHEDNWDQLWALKALMAGWPTLPSGLVAALVAGEVQYEVDKSRDSVVLTITDEQERQWWGERKEGEDGA